MVDLGEGERLLREAKPLVGRVLTQGLPLGVDEWWTWAVNNAPALIAELRAARETIAKLEGLLMAHGIEEGP